MKMMVCILLAGLSVTTAFVVNDYDGPMNFSCQGDTTLRHLSSSHTNYYEDRVWSVGCYPAVARLENCQWTGYVNDFDQTFDFECPGDGFINGIRSFHNNYYEDRKWAFKCCEMQDRVRRNCRNTGFVNSYGGDLSYTTAHAYQNFHGWTSIHNNYYEDRIFDFQVCDYVERDASGF
ncbi:Hemagglutinin/amebocyte aggregation factor [Mizuhopecten yessoensis]|uniref:Hemagglutinin/amebocyte aggregation factor n=1 Tax=Mizuhopecten yessoensis TaxID=6573 RepID=A0A210PNA2_MIZYE|nr:Hemagglutinin/amebocyte aggregation factor [Mizuhopecten yessoensis]